MTETTQLVDIRPAAVTMAAVLAAIDDRQLGDPTPCPDYTVADLVEHVAGLTLAFTAAARKRSPDGHGGPSGDGSRLPAEWRERLRVDLDGLAAAWADPAAHEGFTMAGPFEMPAGEAAKVALDELVVHAWDLARATGQAYAPDPTAVAVSARWVEGFEVPAGGGPFGPRVAVAAHAEPLDRLLGLTGRDPNWAPRS